MKSKKNISQGVNVIGYFQRTLGQGESARLIIQSLEQNHIPYSIYSVDHLADSHHLETIKKPISQKLVYPINLFCIDADHVTHIVEQLGWKEFENKHNIGLWFWETNIIPKHKQRCWDYLDEFWVTSAYTQEHLSAACCKPVYKIPHPIQLSFQSVKNPKKVFKLEDKFTFLFCFDFYSSIERKNPLAIIKGFKKAFPDNPDVRLVIKSHNGKIFPQKLQQVLEIIKNDSRITWMDKGLDSQQRYDLMNACDCYISLHRSEGFGLTMAEAMALGKPVIATGYSGNLDFMTLENSFLCPYQLVRIGEGNVPYPAEGLWADVDVDQAAHWMKFVVTHPEEAKTKAKKGQEFIQKYHSCVNVGQEMANRLATIPSRFSAKKMPSRYKISRCIKIYTDFRKFLRPLKRFTKKIVSTGSSYPS